MEQQDNEVSEVDEMFYDQTGVDRLYSLVWGKNIHFGIYETAEESMETAATRTKRRMAELLGLSSDQTVLEVAEQVHRDIARDLKYARVWGTKSFDGQQVGRDHPLIDGDVVELHT